MKTTPPDPNALAVPVPESLPMPAQYGDHPHDMAIGPCACGATHELSFWPEEVQKDILDSIPRPLTAQDNYDKHYAELQAENGRILKNADDSLRLQSEAADSRIQELESERDKYKAILEGAEYRLHFVLGLSVEKCREIGEEAAKRTRKLAEDLSSAETKAGAMEEAQYAIIDSRLNWPEPPPHEILDDNRMKVRWKDLALTLQAQRNSAENERNAALARAETAEAELERHAFDLSPTMVQARNDQLLELIARAPHTSICNNTGVGHCTCWKSKALLPPAPSVASEKEGKAVKCLCLTTVHEGPKDTPHRIPNPNCPVHSAPTP